MKKIVVVLGLVGILAAVPLAASAAPSEVGAQVHVIKVEGTSTLPPDARQIQMDRLVALQQLLALRDIRVYEQEMRSREALEYLQQRLPWLKI